MLEYITKVDNEHVISINGKNVKVTECRSGTYTYDDIDIRIEDEMVYMRSETLKPFTTVVLSVELVRLCIKQK